MVVLTVFSSPCGLNGAAINLGVTVGALTARGHTVYVLCRKPDQASAHLERCGARLLFFNLPLGMNTTLLLESRAASRWRVCVQNLKDILRVAIGMPLTWLLIRRLRPDVVFLMDITFPQCALVAIATGTPLVCQAQEQLIRGRLGLRRGLVLAILGRSDRLFGITSRHVAPFLAKGRQRQQIEVIPNAVSLPEDWRPTPSTVLDATEARHVLLFCGGANPNKGFRFALELIATLARRDPAFLLVFAGPFNRRYSTPYAAGSAVDLGRETAELFACIRAQGLEAHVRIVGIRSDILSIMAASRAVLVPHRLPHFSRPIIEAFAVGTPVVASRDVFNEDLIEDGVNGCLIEYGHTEAWADRIQKLLMPDYADPLQRQALVVYNRRFTTAAVTPRIVELFESLETTRRPAASS